MSANKNKNENKSTSQLLSDSRNVLYGGENEIASVLNNVLVLLNRMDSRLCTIESNTRKNTETLKQMNDTLTSLTARVITAEHEITDVKTRVGELEATSIGTGNLFDDIKSQTDNIVREVKDLKAEGIDTADENKRTKDKIDTLAVENESLKSRLVDMQCRQMKNNLIFTGLHEQTEEDCELKLRRFIENEMNITHYIEFGKVHRFGKKSEVFNRPPRPIVARFLYFRDVDAVKKAGRNLKGKPYGVNEQFPTEVEQRRRKLYPIMKEEKLKKSKVVLVRDKLYVNNELVEPVDDNDDNLLEPRQGMPRPPKKRSRVSSTPDRR